MRQHFTCAGLYADLLITGSASSLRRWLRGLVDECRAIAARIERDRLK